MGGHRSSSNSKLKVKRKAVFALRVIKSSAPPGARPGRQSRAQCKLKFHGAVAGMGIKEQHLCRVVLLPFNVCALWPGSGCTRYVYTGWLAGPALGPGDLSRADHRLRVLQLLELSPMEQLPSFVLAVHFFGFSFALTGWHLISAGKPQYFVRSIFSSSLRSASSISRSMDL